LTQIGPFEIKALIGEAGFGRVFLMTCWHYSGARLASEETALQSSLSDLMR
jgi:hypothetical protein